MKKKIIALILCICLISCTCIQPAYAMGAEGIIIGGGAAAAGVTLSMPQVALLVAAGFGLVYATQHAEEIYNGLDTALTNAANNIDGGIEQLSTWTAQAAQGEIAIANAPSWIAEAIKDWISGLYESAETPAMAVPQQYQAGEPFPASNFWQNGTKTIDVPCSVVRLGRITTSVVNDVAYYNLYSYCFAIATQTFSGVDGTYLHDNQTYYCNRYLTSLSIPVDQELAGDNLKAYEAVSALPSYDYINENYDGSDINTKVFKAYFDGYWEQFGSICPDEKVGGIEGALDVGGIDNIKVPDLDIGGSGLLAPDNVGTGSIDDVLNDILTRLKTQELSWSDYMDRVAVGTPSITIDGKDYAIDDTGVTDIPVEDVVPDNPPADGVVVPEGLEPFTMSLTDFFPFCIPFDIVDFVNVLCAEPEAPCFDWTFTWYGGDTDTLTIDLSPFDQVAQLLRNMELLLFCIGLALITRNQIRG